jgi:glycosyltransferase involved in cell wall biosynthesis
MNNSKIPFVSICTPTFNRRPFIPYLIQCFQNQTYPKEQIEWIIIDDGTDPIGELVKHIPQVKYYYYEEKMLLGKKRNIMHSHCSGDIIIYMDDDDYYPPQRIEHAVDTLQNTSYLIAGASEMHIYFDTHNRIYQCGPYKEFHSTAATFAFKKELLKITSYDEGNAVAEETIFTKGYTIPLVQLDPLKTILVFSHRHNSLNKEKLLENPSQSKLSLSKYTVDDFIKEPILKQFYMCDMNSALEDYSPGKPENKPIVLAQIKSLEENREKRMREHQQNMELKNRILAATNNSSNQSMEKLRQEYEKKLADKNIIINELIKKIKELTNEVANYKQRMNEIQ